jgi:ubiquinone/menaquinone biosynthesis C-methylase UbiE
MSPPIAGGCNHCCRISGKTVAAQSGEVRLTGRTVRYSDDILDEIRRGNANVASALGANIHLGYWEDEKNPDLSFEGFQQASERLNTEVFKHIDLSKPCRILDVGCGYGGTISDLNRRGSNLQLVGLNVDPNQIARACTEVKPLAANSNTIEFFVGDACELRFPSNSFDYVLAIECIGCFPSRKRFLGQAYRVLKPQGKLIFTDLFFAGDLNSAVGLLALSYKHWFAFRQNRGKTTLPYTEARTLSVLKGLGFAGLSTRDINRKTLPTYEFVRRLSRDCSGGLEALDRGCRLLELARERNYIVAKIIEARKI